MADRTVTVRMRADTSQYVKELAKAAAATQAFSKSAGGRGGKELDNFTGRLGALADAAITLGPAILPLSAAAIPALTASLNGLGAAAGAIGVTLLAFQGIGDGLKALDAYQLAPTTANFAKLQEQMEKLGPSGAHFVHFLDGLEPQLHALQDTARAGLFPGLEDGITSLLTRFPQVKRIVADVADGMGDLAKEAGQSLAGPKFTAFFDYIEHSARPSLEAFAHATGNVAEGVANLIVAFAPMSGGFTAGLERASAAFAKWSEGLDQNQGFQDFLAYVRQNGPAAVDFLGAVVQALAGVAKAAAPFGQTVLPLLTDVAKVFGALANSPIGPGLYAAAAGMIALNRASKLLGPGMTSLSDAFLDLYTSPNRAATAVQRFGGVAKAAAGAAGMGLFIDSLHQTNKSLSAFEATAGGALAGFSVGGPWGAAVGGAIGLIVDLGRSHEEASHEVADLTATFDQQTGAITENTRVKVASSLQSKGLLDDADRLGISTSLVTDAVMGNAQAQAMLNATLAKYPSDYTITSAEDMKRSFSDQEIATTLADRAATHLRDNIPGLSGIFASAAGSAAQLGSAVSGTASSLNQGATAAQRMSDALDHLNNKLDRRSAARDYQAAIDEISKSIKENGHTLDINTAKGRANQAALDNIASTASRLIGTLHGTDKVQAMTQARKDFVDAAQQMGLTIGQARRLANNLGLLNKTQAKPTITADDSRLQGAIRAGSAGLSKLDRSKADPNVTADASAAFGVFNAVQHMLSALDGDSATTYVRTVHQNVFPAGGGRVIGGNATGGLIMGPGTGTSDSILARLSNREYVMKASAVAKYGVSMMDAINAERFADGGHVGARGSRPFTIFTSQEGAGIVDSAHGIAQALKMLQKALDKSSKALDKERQTRDALQDQYDSIKSGVGSAYSSRDPFAALQAGSPWAAGGGMGNPLAAFDLAVAGNTADTQAAQKALAFAQSKGLDGPLYAALAASGNLPLLQQFATLSEAQISQREQAFAGQSNAQAALGTMAANSEVGAQLASANKHLDKLQAEVRGLRRDVKQADQNNVKGHKDNAKHVTDGVNGAASNGHRRGR